MTGEGVRERAAVHPGIAREHGLYVVLANHVGPAGPWTGCGGAAVWAPGGALLAAADDRTPGVVTVEVPAA
ncbi:nitrilase-related carbon-nitrogen hydrolase [Streptomyces sp. NPDC046685]|uniref:nitrilase-related carbon-nitrogen hydrolase n=1 Tax=Streptomyces sp. NPDC046685 TaxID=3157202 RepID=UPI0033C3CA62